MKRPGPDEGGAHGGAHGAVLAFHVDVLAVHLVIGDELRYPFHDDRLRGNGIDRDHVGPA